MTLPFQPILTFPAIFSPIAGLVGFDEKLHKYKLDKDIIRQKEIENYLKCKFIRIDKLYKNFS